MSLLQRITKTLRFRSSPRSSKQPPATILEQGFLPLNRLIDHRALTIPVEFDAGGGNIHLKATFNECPREKLFEICRALPIENLDFYHPGASPEMDRAATVSTLTAIYLAGKDMPPEYGDVVIPRLIAHLERHDPKHLNVLLGPQLENFSIALVNGRRPYEALQCLNMLKRTLFCKAKIVDDRVSAYMLVALYNIANRTKATSDIRAALRQVDALPPEGRERLATVIEELRKMKAQ